MAIKSGLVFTTNLTVDPVGTKSTNCFSSLSTTANKSISELIERTLTTSKSEEPPYAKSAFLLPSLHRYTYRYWAPSFLPTSSFNQRSEAGHLSLASGKVSLPSHALKSKDLSMLHPTSVFSGHWRETKCGGDEGL